MVIAGLRLLLGLNLISELGLLLCCGLVKPKTMNSIIRLNQLFPSAEDWRISFNKHTYVRIVASLILNPNA